MRVGQRRHHLPGKHAGGSSGSNYPSFYLMTKRNSIAFRSPTLGLQANVVQDFRSYLDQWMHFQIDVRWTEDATGYYRVRTKLPGQSSHQFALEYTQVQTWHPANPTDHGYLKWGLYRPGQTLEGGDVPTRVIYHDQLRILDLNNSRGTSGDKQSRERTHD
ncbi:heparin lyase I family protein [Kribbella catacumbae]|uniref:heparin lyase I family protein n=1 Tax=Kribbella catacumbae TaxID=460086 RepID=UPI000361065D|nr:heparin lyase I family protein [Kribbella catacumbae]